MSFDCSFSSAMMIPPYERKILETYKRAKYILRIVIFSEVIQSRQIEESFVLEEKKEKKRN